MSDNIEFRLSNIEKNVEKILLLLNGNGRAGIITQQELLKQKVDDLPTPEKMRWYSIVGGGLVSSAGLITWLVYYFIKNAFTSGG